jgi:hypothetical protein
MSKPMERLQDVLARQREIIQRVGWTVMMVMGNERQPSFAYTVGLSDHSQPELMVIGLPPESAHFILNGMAKKALANLLPNPRGLVHEVANMPLSLRQDDDEGTMGEICRFAQQWSQEQRGLPCGVTQVIFPDEAGRFPWELGCDPRMVTLQDPAILLAAQDDPAAADRYKPPRPN